MTTQVDVHLRAGLPSTVTQDMDRPSSTSRSAARCNYGYVDQDDVQERHRDWPTPQQTRPDFTRPGPGNDLDEMMPYQNPAAADPYRRPPDTSKPLSVISSTMGSSAQTDYNRAGVGVYPADVNLSVNGTGV